jgi:hypothetical protein
MRPFRNVIVAAGIGMVGCLGLLSCGPKTEPGLYEKRQAAEARQDAAIALITQHGGGVAWEDPGANVTIRLNDEKSAAALTAALADIPSVQTLTIINAAVPGVPEKRLDLPSLGTLPNLRYVGLRNLPVGEPTQTFLAAQPMLRAVYLVDSDITDDQLGSLMQRKGLNQVVIAGRHRLSDEGVEAAVEARPDVRLSINP